jgi:4-carboxymuconolactone decarboxylase
MTKMRWPLIVLSLVLVAENAYAQRVPRARIAPLPASEWTDAHRDALGSTARGEQTIDVFTTCVRNVPLCRTWMPFTRYILSADNGVAPREKELLILRTSWLCKADYDWAHHVAAAKRAGFSDEDVLRIAKGADAPGWSPLDVALLRAADELHRDAHVSDQTWAALKQRYSDSQMMDLVFTVGQYTLVSMFANSAGLQLESGELPRLPK